MKLIISNPHQVSFFGSTVLDYFSGIHSTKRYEYLLKYLDSIHQLHVYIDKEASSLPPYIRQFIPKKFEIYLWAIINKYNPFYLKIITDLDKINHKDAVLSLFFRESNSFIQNISTKNFYKIFHVTHFVSDTTNFANKIKKCHPNLLVAENNVFKNSPFFKKYFQKLPLKTVYSLPYVFENRFVSKTSFRSRKNKCFAIGTLVKIDNVANGNIYYKDFINYYHVNALNPIREKIYNDKDQLTNYLDSYISKVFQHQHRVTTENDNIIKKIFTSLYNGYHISKHGYFKFDIVEKYNQYRMFVTPEEQCGLPGIGFVEGMACGCAYIGLNDPMYTDLGLKPGVHYIAYDGSINDLCHKIEYFQNNPQELKTIAKNGSIFIRQNLNGQKVAKTFLSDINKNIKNKSRTICSFTS